MTATWEGLWQHLLHEASSLASKAEQSDEQMGASASSIILARTAWDSFAAEVIEWRDLPREIKNREFEEGIIALCESLSLAKPTFSERGEWRDLRILNQLRNALVHYKAQSRQPKDTPGWFRELEALGIVLHTSKRTWERSACTYRVAHWSCEAVALSMMRVERSTVRRRRSLGSVKRSILTALGRTLPTLSEQ